MVSPLWLRALSRLHLTYLVQDVFRRLVPHKNDWEGFDARILQETYADREVRKRVDARLGDAVETALLERRQSEALRDSLAVFTAILDDWAALAQANGAGFTIVFLPTGRGSRVQRLVGDDYATIDLYRAFKERVPGFDYDHWRFAADWHWNARANHMAAAILYESVAADLGMEPLPAAQVARALDTYYAAFDHGWAPAADAPGGEPQGPVQREIRRRYTALERDGTAEK